jgi:hypothetical protein
VNHFFAHIIGPLKDLWADVHQEGVRRPTTENHDFCGRDVLKEEGHSGPGPDGSISEFVGVETEGGFAAARRASGAEEFPDVMICNKEGFAPYVDSVDLCGGGSRRMVAEDAVNGGAEAQNGTEDGIARPLLGARIFLDPIFLVLKSDCDEVGFCEEVGIRMFEYDLGAGPEDKAVKHDALGATGCGCAGEFTGSHGKEECTKD